MFELFTRIEEAIRQGYGAVIATVIGFKGSTPRISGAKMLIYHDGTTFGSIGGGVMEAEVIKEANQCVKHQCSRTTSYSFYNSSGQNQLDMICGGEMQLLLEYVPPDDNSFTLYKSLNEALRLGNVSLLAGRFSETDNGLHIDRILKTGDANWSGSFQPPAQLETELDTQQVLQSFSRLTTINNQSYIIEGFSPPQTLFLIGGGHVAYEIALFAKRLELNIIVMDDRVEFANKERFPAAEPIVVSQNYANLFNDFTITPDSYIIIMTRGHHFDKVALGQALETTAGYIGMIGSRKKRNQIYSALKKEGVPPQQLQRVHCPIGLKIQAQTPAEIGISVMAELINIRAAVNDDG